MLCIKRLISFAFLPAIVFGYLLYDSIKSERQYQQTQRHALVTAQVWVATARFRSEPESFLTYRDSVLKANGLSKQLMEDYLARYKDHTEKYEPFTTLVNQYVDSLSTSELESMQADTAVKVDFID